MKVDMAAEAIDRRLRATSDLRDFCLRLQGLGAQSPVSELHESSPEYKTGAEDQIKNDDL